MISHHPTLARRPQSYSKLPRHYDPVRRLMGGYVAQAICDFFWPPKSLRLDEWLSAKELVYSPTGQDMIRELDIPITKVRQILGSTATAAQLAEMRRTIVRLEIGRLRQQYGGCFNAWPADIQNRYSQLERELRHLENGGTNGAEVQS